MPAIGRLKCLQSIDAVELLYEVDISRIDGTRRNPLKVRQLLRSLARNVSTEASYPTIRKDVWGEQADLSVDTIIDYIGALERLMMVENLTAWSTHIRSKARLRTTPKRHLADTGLACSALSLSSGKLLSDIEYMGLLFESLVIHDLRIYAEAMGAKLYHYRDSNGIEAIVHGFIWSVIWVVSLLILAKFYPHTLVHNYPKELQRLANVPVKGTRTSLILCSSVLYIAIFGYYMFSVIWTFRSGSVHFIAVVNFSFIIFIVLNVFDLLILDWVFMCNIQPSIFVLEGTKGHKEYKNYVFHFIGFIKGTIIGAVCSLLFGSIAYLILNYFIW
jgi:hypothetical protein